MREHTAQVMYGTGGEPDRGTHEVAGGTHRQFKGEQSKCTGKAKRNVREIDKFRYIKIQPENIDLSTRLFRSLGGLFPRVSC